MTRSFGASSNTVLCAMKSCLYSCALQASKKRTEVKSTVAALAAVKWLPEIQAELSVEHMTKGGGN